MNASHNECPICGASDISSKTTTRTIGVPFVGQRIVSIFVDTCANCGQSGDFFRRNTPIIEAAIHSAEKDFVLQTVEWLSNRGISMAYLERALSLPARTVTRWRDGEFSAAPIALLRLVRTCPWLLAVAEGAFDPEIAAREVVVSAANHLASARVPAIGPASSPVTNINLNFNISNQSSALPTQVTEAPVKVCLPS